jgi:hypothetical protein
MNKDFNVGKVKNQIIEFESKVKKIEIEDLIKALTLNGIKKGDNLIFVSSYIEGKNKTPVKIIINII